MRLSCPDFKVKYIVSRLSDAEAALVNLSENIQREDPKPIQLAHAVRSLTEDYGLTLKQVAGRLKRSEAWLSNLLNLVMLPTAIQESVAKGKTPVSAALELVKLPTDKQVETFDDLASSGEKITAAKASRNPVSDHRKSGVSSSFLSEKMNRHRITPPTPDYAPDYAPDSQPHRQELEVRGERNWDASSFSALSILLAASPFPPFVPVSVFSCVPVSVFGRFERRVGSSVIGLRATVARGTTRRIPCLVFLRSYSRRP